MLSIWKLRVGAENYYLAQVAHGLEDYYSGRGELPGRWVGAAASGLGLGEESVDPDELRAVLAGLQPGTGQSPNGGPPPTWKGRVPGFDLTFAVPKSVSILYAFGDPLVVGEVNAAVDAAVDAAVAWLEREACFVRRGSNSRPVDGSGSTEFGTRRLRGTGFVAAAFRHRTSRAGDPHLHTHVLVANTTRGPDGRWSALDAQGIYRAKHTAGAVFRTALCNQLTHRLGVDWRPTGRGLVEVAGVPAEVISLFSKRRADIEAEMTALGVEGAAAAAAAMLATRIPKTDIDPASLRQRWADEAATVGFTPATIDSLLTIAPAVGDEVALCVRLPDPDTGELHEVEVRSGIFAAWIGARMADIDATCTRHQITQLVASYLPTGSSVHTLETVTSWVLAQPELVPITPPQGTTTPAGGWEQRWTSHRLLTIESEILEVLQQDGPTPPLPTETVEQILADTVWLGADQAAAAHALATSRRAVDVLVGRAGTGKTYTLSTLRAVLCDDTGRRMIGVAPSARAARELADGAGIDAFTFPRFERHIAPNLATGDVIVVDEAGMAGTIDLHRLITRAATVGARVILVGDHHQLPEINAGGVFAAAVNTRTAQVAELTVNRRQTALWQHHALDQLRHGLALEGFRAYQDHGCVTIAATAAEIHTAAVDAWHHTHTGGTDGIILAGTRSEAQALNRLARRHVADQLSGPVLTVRGRDFQAGDRIVLLRNSDGHHDLDRNVRCRVDNGMIATITTIHPDDSIEARMRSGRHIGITGDYVRAGHIDHGYATTIHKAQGITCDQIFLVGPAGLYREAVYVALSRARHGAHIYATNAQVVGLVERPHTTGIPLPDEHDDDIDQQLREAVEQSRAKALALAHDPLLPAIANVADHADLAWLTDRHHHCRHVATELVRHGVEDPTQAQIQLERARVHRQYLSPGTRVNTADWDNLGTVVAVSDDTGTVYIEFVSTDGQRHARKMLDWAETKPVDHPEPVELTAAANAYLKLAQAAVAEHAAEWHTRLDQHGIHPDELHVIPAAIAMRRQRLAHQLAGHPPAWLTWWYGPRSSDPIGAQVWDDEIAHLAAWRDTHHLDPDTPGYGPPPEDPHHHRQWADHQDRSLRTRHWLHHHSPTLPTPNSQPVDIAATRARLAELNTLLAGAPPDQTRIVDAIRTGTLTPADTHQALVDAADTQHARRQWILEHWPHVVEHAELSRISHTHDPLAHWPTPSDPHVVELHRQLSAISTDTPEPATLLDLDEQLAHHHPATIQHRLQRQQAELIARLEQIDRVAVQADPQQAAILNQHHQRLTERLAETQHEADGHAARVTAWNLAATPHHLQDAINRRANHLAHHAITTNQPWIDTAISDWTQNHPAETLDELRHAITDIAAHRERTGHHGPDPIGPQPSSTNQPRATQEPLGSTVRPPQSPDVGGLAR